MYYLFYVDIVVCRTNAIQWVCSCSRSFSLDIRFAGFCYGQFVAMRCKFKLVTYVRGPLVVDRRGGTERNLN